MGIIFNQTNKNAGNVVNTRKGTVEDIAVNLGRLEIYTKDCGPVVYLDGKPVKAVSLTLELAVGDVAMLTIKEIL